MTDEIQCPHCGKTRFTEETFIIDRHKWMEPPGLELFIFGMVFLAVAVFLAVLIIINWNAPGIPGVSLLFYLFLFTVVGVPLVYGYLRADKDKLITHKCGSCGNTFMRDKTESKIIKSCETCHKYFSQAEEEKELCPSCSRLNKIKGWLILFIIWTLGSSLDNFYLAYLFIRQNASSLEGIAFIYFGIYFLIGFVFFIIKFPGTRAYMLSIIIIYFIVLTHIFYGLIEEWIFFYIYFKHIILFSYFVFSRRAKVIYSQK